MQTLIAIGAWISSHTNKITEFVRQGIYALLLFHIIDWTPEQQIGALAAISAMLAMFTEGGTVSKQRMGERVAEVEAKVDAKVDAKIAQMATHNITDSGGRI